MDVRTVLLAAALLLWIGIQYGLIVWAVRDLSLRPRVRGGNKATWALLILIVPVIGPLIYAVYGPASFMPRPPSSMANRTVNRPPQTPSESPRV